MERSELEAKRIARGGIHGPYQRISYCHQPDCQGRRQCRECRNAYMRATRKPYKDLPDLVKKKMNCRAYTKVLQQRGKLPLGPCEACGCEKAQNHHHWGYDNPRWFIRMCQDCHLSLEEKLQDEAAWRWRKEQLAKLPAA